MAFSEPAPAETAATATVLNEGPTEAQRPVWEILWRHAEGTGRGLYLFAQWAKEVGFTFGVATAGGAVQALPPRVMDDTGASCNLMAAAYARRIGAKVLPMKRRIRGSTGSCARITEGVLVDLTIAAGTPYEQRVPQQLFLLTESDALFDALMGNHTIKCTALQGHVHGVTGRFEYTAASGERASVPTVSSLVSAKEGAAAAACVWDGLCDTYGQPMAELRYADDWEVALVTGEEEEQEPEEFHECEEGGDAASTDEFLDCEEGGDAASTDEFFDCAEEGTSAEEAPLPRASWRQPREAVTCLVEAMGPPAHWAGLACLLLQVLPWCLAHGHWTGAGAAAAASVVWGWQGQRAVRAAAPALALALRLVMLVAWGGAYGLHWWARAWLGSLLGRALRAVGAWMAALAEQMYRARAPPAQETLTRRHVSARRRAAKELQPKHGRLRGAGQARKRAGGHPCRYKTNSQKRRYLPRSHWRGGAPLVLSLTLAAAVGAVALGLVLGLGGWAGLALRGLPAAAPINVALLAMMGVSSEQAAMVNTTVLAFIPDGEYLPPPGAHYTKDEACGWLYGNHRDFSPAQLETLQQQVRGLKHCFAFELSDLAGYSGPLGEFRIPLTHDKPIYEGPRRCSPVELSVVKEAVRDLEDAGFVEPCTRNGRYACNMVVAAKKDEHGVWNALRTCHDYRRLNAATLREEHGLPHADDLFQWLGTRRIYTKLDLRSGFYQIGVAPEDRNKTAFWCDRKMYRFTRMPFGLKCAPIYFQRVVDACLSEGDCMDCARGFIDDIIIASETPDQHIQDVAKVLAALNAHGLKVHPHKSVFGAECVEYLGHNISRFGTTPNEAKVAAIQGMAAPTNISELRAVLGLLSYYRVYCRDFGAIAAPLTALTSPRVRWTWGPEQQDALDRLKAQICTPGRAVRPVDYARPIFVHTDWSTKGIGAVIGQKDADGNEYMCACISRSLNAAEQKYEASKGEMLAAVWAIKQFRPFLYGVPFTLVTDHSALKWLLTNPHLTGQYARWAAIVQEHDLTVVHRQGTAHSNADALSRLPLAATHDTSGAQLDVMAAAAAAAECVGGGGDVGEAWQEAALAAAGGLACRPAHALAAMAPETQEQQMRDPEAARDLEVVTCWQEAQTRGRSFIDSYAPTNFQLFQGHNGSLLDMGESEPWADAAAATADREDMHAKAARWVRKAMQSRPPEPSVKQPLKYAPGPADAQGVRPVRALNTSVVAPTFFAAAQAEGITLFEPFGGLCAGLEMVLRNGIKVKRYVYCDNYGPCQAVARHRVEELSARFPTLLTLEAVEGMFSVPQCVRRLGTAELVQAGALDGSQWMVVGGWECQGLSAAGAGRGLRDSRSNTFYDLLRVVGTLQQLQPRRPPAYLLENTHMNHTTGSVKESDYPEICKAIGTPILLDAAQCGSYAHRLRNFWTNIVDTGQLRHVFFTAVRRAPGRHVNDILDPGRVVAPCRRTTSSNNTTPWYVCNKGSPEAPGLRCALPTLMATPGSYSFRDRKAGCVYKEGSQPPEYADPPEPNPDERERALGYPTGATAAPGVTPLQRHRITGGCMDANALEHMFAASLYLDRWHAQGTTGPGATAAAAASHQGPHEAPDGAPVVSFAAWSVVNEATVHALATAAEGTGEGGDVWTDAEAAGYLKSRIMPPGASAAMRRRLQRYGQLYTWQSGKLYRRMADGSTRVVPPPEQRPALVARAHEKMGHLGEKRTAGLLLTKMWWRGLRADVSAMVGACEACARARAVFHQHQPELTPLPIKGLFYRWGVDLAGPLPKTPRGNEYIMICVEHWSKTLVLVPLADKEAATTAYAFLHHVLAKFGAPAEVLTDQGGEWCAEFQQLLTDTFADHRTTSASHPASNGLAERAVQTVKTALRAYAHEKESTADWDRYCAWLALGYNCSPQASTRLAPYHVLYGRPPSIPSSIQEHLAAPISLGDPLGVVADVLLRADAVRRVAPTIDSNLAIAQHRDTQRYQAVRSGMYVGGTGKPFEVGEFVWLKRHEPSNALQTGTMPPILRVHKVWPQGMLTLMGKCGRTIKAHSAHCARCSLPGIDPTINPALRPYERGLACKVCASPKGEAAMLLCDGCGQGWHKGCLEPPLADLPPDGTPWWCPECEAAGLTEGDIERMRASDGPEPRLADGIIFPDARSRRYQALCASYEGRVVTRVFNHPVNKKPCTYWGTVHYRGIESRPEYFMVRYTDGDEETMTLAKLKKHLKPPGTKIPAAAYNESAPAATRRSPRRRETAASASEGASPAPAPSAGPTTAEALLIRGMPGDWPEGYRANAQTALDAYLQGRAPTLGHKPASVEPLVGAVDLASSLSVLDPFGDTAAVATGLARAGISVTVGLRKRPRPHNAMADVFYERQRREGPVEAIVTAPWPGLLDMALPLMASHAARVVCCLVPLGYLCHAPEPRRAWLMDAKRAGRLFFTHVPAEAVGPTPHVWMIVFASRALAERSLRTHGAWSAIL